MHSRVTLTTISFLLLLFVVGFTLRGISSMPTHAAKSTQSWHLIASPPVSGGILRAVAAIAATNVWAVGSWNNSTGSSPLIEHYNGKQWSVVASPNVGAGQLNAVKALSAINIWAIGSAISNGSALIEHYNGVQWGSVFSPLPGDGYTTYSLTGMTVVSASNIWASGYSIAGDSNQTLIEHYDGIQWNVVPTPTSNYYNYSMFSAINAASANDIWAVGSSWDAIADQGFATSNLAEHWDGFQWSVISTPSPGYNNTFDDTLNAVIAVSSHDVRAVGAAGASSSPLGEHWDGIQWTYGYPPSGGSTQNSLDGEIAFATSNIWAVGSTGKAIIEHWNGVNWSVVANPVTTSPYSELLGITKVPGNTTLWAVGDLYNNLYQPLIEFYS